MNALRSLSVVGLACLCAQLSWSPPAAAQAPDISAAKQHYTAATRAMKAGEYEIAAREFGVAYDITKDPVIFFRIGEANLLAGDCQTAQVYFGRYLREAHPTNDEYKRLTNEKIEECKKKLGTSQKAAEEPDEATKPASSTSIGSAGTDEGGFAATTGDASEGSIGPAVGETSPSFVDAKPTWKSTAGWVAVGTGLAAATAGAILGLSATSRQEDIQTLVDFRDNKGQGAAYTGVTKKKYDDLVDEGEKLNTYSMIAFGAAGAAAVSAVVFFLLDAKDDSKVAASARNDRRQTPTVTVAPTNDSLTFGASWEF